MKQINNRTKIIATIGPSSSEYDTLKEMIKSGVDVVRLNFSHGKHEDHKKTEKDGSHKGHHHHHWYCLGTDNFK